MGGDHDYRKDLSHLSWTEIWDRQARRGDLAPLWWSQAEGRPGLRVLDVGCGPGFFSLEWARRTGPGGRVVATDVSREALDFLRRKAKDVPRLETLRLDAQREAPPGEFDVAFVTDVLHHVDDPLALLRALRPRAARLLVAEFDPAGPGLLGPPLHERLDAAEATRLLAESGWHPGPVQAQPHEHYALVAE